MIKYRLRPAYGSKESLIEFSSKPGHGDFIFKLETALSPLNTVIVASEDLGMNDEMLVQAKCDLGAFEISLDDWGFAFIMANENPELMVQIAPLLHKSPVFEKGLVDFENSESKNE